MTDPSKAEIGLVSNTVTTTNVKVTAKGADAHSGVYSYTFQKSTTSATSGFDTGVEKTSTNGTYEYEYTNLTPGTTNYLRVIVKDKVRKNKNKQCFEIMRYISM